MGIYFMILELDFKIFFLLHRNWKVRIRHIASAHNEIVDFMAKHAATGFISIQVFSIPPQAMQGLIQKVILGV
ncbi:hypothetical protein J1N35_012715 [Gossypium stocksii]|uniref:Uncharacterized protein n=1 Tax=Gossypium stocksii TaxID=47602 RepID=A0A9D3W5Z2_9ROSI|nr:hypothetical protein J1N35_012715 [Gossypium stocksii]